MVLFFYESCILQLWISFTQKIHYMFLRQDSIKIFPSKKILSQIKFFCLTSIEIEKLLV